MKTQRPSPSAILQNDFQFEQSRERETLLRRYKNKEAILSQLREMPVHARTYEFLGELFFNVAARELENDPPTEEWLRNLSEIRSEVYLLFELARAAKVVAGKARVPGSQGRPGKRL
jgi:hypothetical protein